MELQFIGQQTHGVFMFVLPMVQVIVQIYRLVHPLYLQTIYKWGESVIQLRVVVLSHKVLVMFSLVDNK
jgi:hypothetical protein